MIGLTRLSKTVGDALISSQATNKPGQLGQYLFRPWNSAVLLFFRGQLRLVKEDWAGGVEDLDEAHRLQPSPQVMLMRWYIWLNDSAM